jgi:pre-rRNA-processing protein TSR1
MAADVQQQHRPGALKQQNKSHKHGKHKSKGQMDKDTKGKVADCFKVAAQRKLHNCPNLLVIYLIYLK